LAWLFFWLLFVGERHPSVRSLPRRPCEDIVNNH
jgi:hypothetical protein